MSTCAVIVVGHVNHGKTSLVRALTGTDTDRLPEEKLRGMSIVPGFAWLRHCGSDIDLIDAPGHADFVRSMISGASGARAVMLVISAVQGIEAQTIEHIEIASALGISDAVVAITKADLMPAGDFAEREAALRASLAATAYAGAPFVFCSAVTGSGLGTLADLLLAFTQQSLNARRPSGAFLPVDRVFVAEGHGTVVTGTLLGAAITSNDPLILASTGKAVSIRRIQVRGQTSDVAAPGERTALNLRGLSAQEVSPGDVLHAPDAFPTSFSCDCSINLSERTHRPLRHMQEVRVHHATAQATARLHLLGAHTINPGEQGLAQLRFRSPICMFAGQRVVLRSLSPTGTLGGASILDPVARPLRADKAARTASLRAALYGDIRKLAEALAHEDGGVADVGDICRISGRSSAELRATLLPAFLEVGKTGFAPAQTAGRVQNAYLSDLAAYHMTYPLRPNAPRASLWDRRIAPALTALSEAQLADAGEIILTGTQVALASHSPLEKLTSSDQSRMDLIATALRSAGLTPPARNQLISGPDDEDLLALMIHTGQITELFNVSLKQTVLLHAEAVAEAARLLAALYPERAAFKTGEAREALKTSRKCVVPLLEHFDALGVTIRSGDTRYIA